MENFFQGNPEEEQWVKDILTGMGYTVDARTFCCAPADCLPAVRKDVAEIGAEAFMAAVPAGTGIRQRAVFSRFLKALQEEKDENLGAPDGDVVSVPKTTTHVEIPSFPSAAAHADDSYYLMVHNMNTEELDPYDVSIRVMHGSRFVDYPLKPGVMKLVLPKEAGLHIVSSPQGSEVKMLHRHPVGNLPEKAGSNLYVLSWKVSDGHRFKAVFGPPVKMNEKTYSVYHYCPKLSEQGNVNFWHTMPSETPSEANGKVLDAYHGHGIESLDQSKVTLRLAWTTKTRVGKQNLTHQHHKEVDWMAERYKGFHVYVLEEGREMTPVKGLSLAELPEWNATTDLAALEGPQTGGQRPLVVHNMDSVLTDKKHKFQLKFTVKSDGKSGDFQLQSFGHKEIRLPPGASLEVEAEGEGLGGKGSLTLEASELEKLEAGSNVYFCTELDYETRTEEEKAIICKAFWFIWLPPVFLILFCIFAGKANELREKRGPLLQIKKYIFPPTGGAKSAKSSIWHCCLAEEPNPKGPTIFLSVKDDPQGTFVQAGQSQVLDDVGSKLRLTVRLPPASEESTKDKTLMDKTMDLDMTKFTDKHVYVLPDHESKEEFLFLIRAGTGSLDVLWDASQYLRAGEVDLEANMPSNQPSNQPEVSPPGVIEGR